MKAIVNKQLCPLYSRPTRESTLVDEALYGMVVEILSEAAPGWLHIRTPYRYEGIAAAEDLLLEDAAAREWEAAEKYMVLRRNHCDVLSQPKVQGYLMQTLPRGGLLRPLGQAENGWQRVCLADGREGFVPASILVKQPLAPVSREEGQLRRALVDMAMLYQGTHYRWGGKSPQGIDCSGLCSMAYLLCGITIYRDADIKEGFPLRPIPREAMQPGDLLFFPGHVAMYLGDGRYCHSTATCGGTGFTVNSLDPNAPDYRQDLHQNMTQVGSIF